MDSEFFIKELKRQLKHARIGYRELASALKMSEAGVKKLLNKSDLSMARAAQVCEVLGLSLADVLKSTEESLRAEQSFDDLQIRHFVRNPEHFKIYMKLVHEKVSLDEIIGSGQVDKKAIFRAIKSLEDLKLLKLIPGNRVQSVGGEVGRVNTNGTALENLKVDFTVDFIRRIGVEKTGTIYGGVYLLPPEEARELQEQLSELQMRYTHRSSTHRRLKRHQGERAAKTVSIVLAVGPFSLFD